MMNNACHTMDASKKAPLDQNTAATGAQAAGSAMIALASRICVACSRPADVQHVELHLSTAHASSAAAGMRHEMLL